MYAVIQSGGKQYRVQPGDIIQFEKLEGEVGSSLHLDQVLMVGQPGAENSQIWLGKPHLSGASVDAEIVGQGRGDKIIIVKMKRRKQYRRTQGHRQNYTQVLVTCIKNGAGESAILSAEDKKAKMGRFQSHLKPKGEAFTQPKWQIQSAPTTTGLLSIKSAAPKAAPKRKSTSTKSSAGASGKKK